MPWTAARRVPCPSLVPRVCSSSCPLSQWCHPSISSCHPLFLFPSIFPRIRVLYTHTLSFVTFSSIISYYKILSIVSCVMQQVTVDYLSYTWKVKVSVAQSCPTLCNPMDHRPPGSSVHGILQTRILEWVVTAFSRGSSWPRDWTQLSCIAGGFFTVWATI